MTDLGPLNYLIGINVTGDHQHMFLFYQKYATKQVKMFNCKPAHTPSDTHVKFDVIGHRVTDHTLYRSLAVTLYHLNFTRPYKTYVIQ